jgi:hypothetical protein
VNRRMSDDEIVDLLKASDTVPEPSPLFWEHAARRVRTAIDREPAHVPSLLRRLVWTGGGLAAAALMTSLVVLRTVPVVPSETNPMSAVPTPVNESASTEDAWAFVASLGDELDVDAVEGAGWLARGETADRAVQALDADERDELAALLHGVLMPPEI